MKLTTVTVSSYVLTILSICFTLSSAQAQDEAFPNPENVRIEGNTLHWDPVSDASGYNILFNARDVTDFVFTRNMNYLDTVRGSTEYNVSEIGTYQVIAFNQDASQFSPTNSMGDAYYNPNNESVERPNELLTADLMQVRSKTCANVEPGGSCRAICPLQHDIATGGACSTSDIVEADATATTISYQCSVPLFSGFVTAHVYCMNTAIFQRSQNSSVFGYR